MAVARKTQQHRLSFIGEFAALELAQDLLHFVNARPARAEHVYAIAGRWGDIARLAETGERADAIFESERLRLERNLERMRRGSHSVRRELIADVREKLERTVFVSARARLNDHGELVFEVLPHVRGVEGFVSLGLAVLMDKRRGIGAKLRCCPLPGCATWHVRSAVEADTGRPASYCCAEHQLMAHEPARLRQFLAQRSSSCSACPEPV
jgi:hypothetical protein